MVERYDILGLGCTAVDDLLYVDRYPAADEKMRVRRRERQGGGLTGTALVAAARMGARCQYAGGLGSDELSCFVAQRLAEAGVGLDYVDRYGEPRPVHAVIIVDEHRHTRAIFYDPAGAGRARVDWPPDDVIRAARVLFVDHYGLEGMLRAVGVARAAGTAVVGDFEATDTDEQFAELLALTDHPVTSRDFACRWTGCEHPADAARALWNDARQAVVVTCGAEGAWYIGVDDPDRPRHQPALPVTVVDTTGCGDVFHGAYAAALAAGLDLPARVRFAAAAAALKATRCGGQAGIPTRAAVDAFLRDHRP